MSGALSSFFLLVVTIWALLITRKRGLVAQVVIEALFLAAIGAFLLWHGAAPILRDAKFPEGFSGTWLRALAIIWWLVGARLVANIAVIAHGQDPKSREVRLFSDLTAAVIYITAILVILDLVFDLPVKGLLATSGVVAIVIGLALQNTLGDVFAGIAVGMERPFHVGDRVSFGNDTEGVLVQINWRSIRIRTDGDDLATIPNSVVARGQIVNRSVPTVRRSSAIEISAPSDSPSDEVLELMRHATLLCPEVLANPAPITSIRQAGVFEVVYGVNFFVADSSSLGPAKSSLLRQMRRFFYHAGVGNSGPIRPAALLASLVLFEALTHEEVQQLAGRLIAHSVEPGDVLFEQGSAGSSIYVVQSGVLELVRHSLPATGQLLGRIGPGEYIGELGLVAGVPRGVTMTALTSARVLELPGDSLAELLGSNVALKVAMEKSVRKGFATLQRDEAARSADQEQQTPALFARIRTFFGV